MKALQQIDMVKQLREDLEVNSLLQFLIFGQCAGNKKIVTERNADDAKETGNAFQQRIKRMKTANLIESRKKQKIAQDSTSAYDKSFFMLHQFNQMKSIVANQSFVNNENQIVCADIVCDVLEEMRRERKMIMVIKNANSVKEYVLTDIQMYKPVTGYVSHKDKANMFQIMQDRLEANLREQNLPAITQRIILQKEKFRNEFAQRLSIIKLKYIFEVIKKNSDKYSILDPARFKEKKEILEQRESKNRKLATNKMVLGYAEDLSAQVHANTSKMSGAIDIE